jgi:FtsP/CotA-like multicopper oxidase with cupredoxin domain
MDQPLVEPEARRSANGVLSTSLRCAYAYRDIGGMRLYLRSYEGGLAPTLRMKPGETLKIRLINDLPPNRDLRPANPSFPHQNNNTNFHFHGAHCSPSGIADNVMRSMLPGKSYDIEITLPADHTRGTYWYHPHHHGSADVQVASGMTGAIVVEGDFADVPEIARARERVMLLSEVVFDSSYMVEDMARSFRKPRRASWRSTASGGRSSTCGRGGAALAAGRLAVPEQHAAGTRQAPAERHRLRRHPAGRPAGDEAAADVAGTARRRAGPGGRSGHLRAERHAVRPGPRFAHRTAGARGRRRRSAADEAAGRTAQAAARADRRQRDHRPAHAGPGGHVAGGRCRGHWQEYSFTVDGKIFDPARIDQRVRLGAVEEWTIRNTHEHDDHIFHIHTNPFQVIEIGGQPQADRPWRDTAVVPRPAKGGSIVIRSRFLDYTGVFMMHCHMMNHEEMGMMQAVEVYKE